MKSSREFPLANLPVFCMMQNVSIVIKDDFMGKEVSQWMGKCQYTFRIFLNRLWKKQTGNSVEKDQNPPRITKMV